MGVVVGCDLAGGILKIKDFDADSDSEEPVFVFKLCNQDINKINDFFIHVRTKISQPIDYFTTVLDNSYKNDFCKKYIEIGCKYDISCMNIIGIQHTLFLKAIHEITGPVNMCDTLWIFSIWKNQVYLTEWIQMNGWKFMEFKREQKGLGVHSSVKAISTLKSTNKTLNKKQPRFVTIYNKNLKASATRPNSKLNFKEDVLNSEMKAILDLFDNTTEVKFQEYLEWCDWALIHASTNYSGKRCGEYKHEILLEKEIKFKFRNDFDRRILKWQTLPIIMKIDFQPGDNDTIEIFEDDISLNNIHLEKQKALNVTIVIDINGIYDVNINYDTSYFGKIKVQSITDQSKETLDLPHQQRNLNFFIPMKISEYDNKLNAVGIDLGTTECCAAVIRKSGPDFVVLDQTSNNRTMPSYVAFDERQPKCGKIVVDRMRHKFEYTVYDSKRIIGKSYERLAIDPLWPFTVSEMHENVMIEIKTYDGVAKLKSEEISAALLKHIKLMVEQYQGTILTEAVITIPSEFTEKQKQATKTAAEMAGWKTVHFIPEPVAAAFAYFSEIDIPDNSNILICDCGGGTIDICVAKVSNKQLDCLSFDGDAYLGGRDFDKVLYNHFNAILKHKYEIDVKESNRKYILNQKCQDIKHNLSTAFEDWLDIDNFLADSNSLIKVQRDEFEELSAPLLLRIKNVIYNAISKTSLECKQINYVFQVGGGCRMPMIKEMLKEIFPQAKHECNLYPDWVVAHGAALYAYFLKTET